MVVPDEVATAAKDGNIGAMEAWFAGGGDPDDRDKDGWTLLNIATSPTRCAVKKPGQGKPKPPSAAARCDAMRALLRAGADANGTTADGWAPIHSAAYDGRADAAAILLDHGAKADLPSITGRTALEYAATRDHRAVVRVLLARGASKGRSEDVARQCGHDAVAGLIAGLGDGASQ